MADTAPTPSFGPAGEDDAGEFPLPHLEPGEPLDTEDERDRYDDQILAALVSP